MPPRTARTKATAVQPAPEPEPAEDTDEAVDDGDLIVLSSKGARKPQLIEVFTLDDQPVYINAANPAGVILKAMRATAADRSVVGMMLLIERVLGKKVMDALEDHPEIDEMTIARIANKIMSIATGEAEPGKP